MMRGLLGDGAASGDVDSRAHPPMPAIYAFFLIASLRMFTTLA